MLPELARRIVAEYSKPGDLVLDPMAGIGTTLVEAARLDRRALGIEVEERWAELARRNLDAILEGTERSLAEIRVGDARSLDTRLAEAAGTFDLVCTSPPYGVDAGVIDKPGWLKGGRVCPPETLNYSPARSNLGHARGGRYTTEIAAVYAGCFSLLRPGGLLVTVTKNSRRNGRLFDLAGTTVSVARSVGFGYRQHVVALHAAIRDGDLVARPSYWQLTQVRHARSNGAPTHLVVHEDVCVFEKPIEKENHLAH
jgi:DNA modification methylase